MNSRHAPMKRLRILYMVTAILIGCFFLFMAWAAWIVTDKNGVGTAMAATPDNYTKQSITSLIIGIFFVLSPLLWWIAGLVRTKKR